MIKIGEPKPEPRKTSRLIRADACQLVVIDVQERLVPAMTSPDALLKACGLLVRTASILQIPITLSEQYPAGLGPTVAEISTRVPAGRTFPKMEFSIFGNPALGQALSGHPTRTQLVVAGVEAHVCVLQSVLDAVDAGFDVFVVADALSSRRGEDKRIAIERMTRAGAIPITTEMLVFEGLRSASSPHFRELSRLVR